MEALVITEQFFAGLHFLMLLYTSNSSGRRKQEKISNYVPLLNFKWVVKF